MAKIIIIDDDPDVCKILTLLIQKMNHVVDCQHTIKDGLKAINNNSYDLVLLDVRLPDGNGLDIIPQIQETKSKPEIIIMTGYGELDSAEIALKSGVWDYLQKSCSPKTFILPLQRAIQYREGLKKIIKPSISLNLNGLIGESVLMKNCFELLAQAANNEENVLITGDTGTGKERFARCIHTNSIQNNHNFVVVDCAALPGSLVESLLFGHEKGSFTDASANKDGMVKEAHLGTLFLDEIGELPLNIQKSFLRVLQEKRFRPVGGKKEIESQFRLISATNKNLDEMVKKNLFRKDLLFRIRSIAIDLPPLEKRKDDIKNLLFHYTNKFCTQRKTTIKGFSPEFLEAVLNYDWPGNVRELISAIDRSLSNAQYEPVLFPLHLPMHIRTALVHKNIKDKDFVVDTILENRLDQLDEMPDLKTIVEMTEKKYIEKLVNDTNGNVKEICKISGISRTRLYERLKKYSIKRFL